MRLFFKKKKSTQLNKSVLLYNIQIYNSYRTRSSTNVFNYIMHTKSLRRK